MKGVNGEQALLAILLLLLTSLATVSGSMPVVESIETFFEEPMHTTNSQQQFVSETFTSCNTGHQQELEEPEEPFGNCNRESVSNFTQKEKFGGHQGSKPNNDKFTQKEKFGGHGTHSMIIEPFQGSLYSKF